MMRTLFDIINQWTLFYNETELENTLVEVSNPFNDEGVTFQLLEDLWDLLKKKDDSKESMTDIRMEILIDKLLGDEDRAKVAKFVQIDYPSLTVLNAKETIAKFPDWFEPYEGMTWDEAKSSLFDK
ncbi:MAG: hypothetical protein ACFFEK_10865 [Candidatus Thorarchaeota archaeon]